MISDNQIAANAGWNEEMLATELAALKEEAFDLDLLGFDAAEIDRLLTDTNDGAADLDEAPEPPAETVSRPGDLWICGEHRVLCGNATVLADVETVLGGESPTWLSQIHRTMLTTPIRQRTSCAVRTGRS
jgi:hypothetical protein